MTDSTDDDVKTLHSMGYAQELSRRMSGFSNFAISFSIICILAGGITSFPTAICTGSGFGVAIGWLVGGFFALIVAASLAQIGSAYPTAGGLYHWSSILGGRGWGWATAWFNLIGLIFVVVIGQCGRLLALPRPGCADLPHRRIRLGPEGADDRGRPHHRNPGPVQPFRDQGHHGADGLFRLFHLCRGRRRSHRSPSLIWGAGFNVSRLTTVRQHDRGDLGRRLRARARGPRIVAFLIGLLYPLYTITGFDASAHTAEETKNARVSRCRRGMLNAVFWSLVFGFFMAISFVLASP